MPWALAVSFAILLGASGCGGGAEEETAYRTPKIDWGSPAGVDPTGVMILIHAGGWQPDLAAYQAQRPQAAAAQAGGYATVMIGYSEGAEGLREIERVYEAARRRYPGLPICAYGTSAGGHLALMLAARYPDLSCVVDLIGPTDLTSLDEQGSAEADRLAVEAFGEDELADYSPVRYADRIKAKVLMILADTDPLIPVEQGRELARSLPSAELFVLPEGPVPWLHGAMVTEESVAEAEQRQFVFIRDAIRQR